MSQEGGPGSVTRVLPVAEALPGGFRLKVVEGSASLVGQEVRRSGPCVIGRSDDCDVPIADPSASRRHARVEPGAGGGFRLFDLGSANGTWIGDRRVTESPLDNLDRFRVGGTVLEFYRDDEAAGEDVELARTLSMPAREILESIQFALASKLESEGEPVVVAGNRPFLLDQPGVLWLIEEGALDVFAVAIRDSEPVGARSHFTTVKAGEAVFGMDVASYGFDSAFLASGKTGTRLRKLSIDTLQKLVAGGRDVERIAGLVDSWVDALSRAVVRDLPPSPAADVELEERQPATIGFQKRARSRKGVVWVPLTDSAALFTSLSEISFGPGVILFPVTRDAWIESDEADLKVDPIGVVAALGRPGFWRSLEVFHQVLSECEFLNKKLATVDEFDRLKNKAENAEAAQKAAYEDIGAVLVSPAEKRKERQDIGDVEPVFRACRSICDELGMEARKPPESKVPRSFEDNLAAVAMLSRFRTRQVALRDDWWRHDEGPILAKVEATGEPVALLPRGPSAYDALGADGRRQPVTRELAQGLEPFGYVFYRRFPDGALRVLDVVRFGVRNMKSDFVAVATMGIAMGLLGALTPYFTGRLFDTAIPQAERGLLLQYCLALLVAGVATAAYKMTQSIAVLRVQGKMDYGIQAALWDRLLDLPTTFFRKYASGDLADRAQGIDAIRQLLAGAGVNAILGALSSVFYVGLMFTYSLPLALLGIALTLVFIGFTTTANYLQLRSQRSQLAMKGHITGLVLQLISGVGKLRVCGAENHGFRVWAREFADQRRLAFRVGQIQNAVTVFNAGFPVLSSMAIFAVLVSVQQNAAVKGSALDLTTGDFVGFVAAFGLFTAAMQSLSDASLSLLKAVPIWERLEPILTTPPEIDDSKAAPAPLKGAIELSHLWFRYSEDGPWIIQDLSLSIKAGEYVAFVGGSGCGKSTLMRLMLGFERPEKGTIYYDGQDLASLDARLLRQQLGVVLQESRVLPADIYRNIVGSSSRTVEEAWEAAEMSGFAQDIKDMPMGMHTYVSEGGGGFSGGQKQRLMIARAMVNKPKVLFLDEATSALDNRTQALVTQSMDRMQATRIVIAHRLSTIINADRICFLELGQMKESGSYTELMEKNGLFAELARRQIA